MLISAEIKIFEFFFKDFAADIKKFHQEHKENSQVNNDDNFLVTQKLLGSCPSLKSLTPSKSSSAADERRTNSMMSLEDVELNNEDIALGHQYTKEENAKIHKGIFNWSYQFCFGLLTFFLQNSKENSQ